MGEIFLRNQNGGGSDAESIESAVITLTPSSFTYDGNEKTQGVASVVLDGVTLTEGTDYVVIGNKATDAGQHTLTVVGVLAYTGAATANWSIAKVTLTKPTISTGSFTYEPNTPRTPILNSDYDSTTMILSGDTSATDAGDYTLTVALRDTDNYKWADDSTASFTLAWSIGKKPLTKPTISSGSFTYAPNTTRTPTTDSAYSSATMAKGGDTDAINAGDYALEISLLDTDNYQWAGGGTAPLSLPWSIAKAQGVILASPASVSIAGLDGTATAAITHTGDGRVTVRSSNNNIARAEISGDTVTITGTGGGSATITVTMAEGDNYLGASCTIEVEVITAKVYGVVWNYGSGSGTALSRLTPTSDPYGYVNTTISTEPVPAVGTGSGSSPFDSCAPWKDMDEYNIVNNAVSYRKGESGFSRSSYDTVVKLPAFYFRVVDNASKRYYYISDNLIDGFTLHPGSGCYVGRYHTGDSSGYVSRTGLAAVVDITRATARTNSHSKGANWWQWGIAQWAAIQLLYLIEFADFNVQTKIGNGRAYSSGSAQNSGGTDSMVYHTGRASGTENQAAVQYRHIENLWGNYCAWLDGVNFNNRAAYVCTDPSKFADDTSTNYTAVGITLPSSDGYISALGMSSACPWVMLPTAAAGSETTYVPDYVWSSTGWHVAYVAGYYNSSNPGRFGLWFLSKSYVSSYANSNLSSRLLFAS